jgi:hypothetical protein
MKIYVENVMLGLSGLVFFGGGMMSDRTGENLWFFGGLGVMILASFVYIGMQPYRWKNKVIKSARRIPVNANRFPKLSRQVNKRNNLRHLKHTFVLNDSVLMFEDSK